MKYFANLEKLSIELQQKELNLEQYLYGNDSGRAARWKEIVFLLQLCHDALSAPASDAVHGPLSCAPLPDMQRIREIETLIGSLLVDELYFDKRDAFRSINALRTSSHGFEHYSSSFRRDTFRQVSSILGRDSTSMESFNSPVEFYGEMFDRDISWKRSRNFLAYSSHLYLLYLALGELADLQQVIKNFREQKLPESTSLDSLDLPPTEEVTNRNSDLSRDTECAELGPSCSTSELPQGGSHSSDDSRSGSEMEIDVDYVADGPSSVQGSLLFTDARRRPPSWTDNLTLVGSESTFISDENPDHKAMDWNPSKVQSSTALQRLENAAVGESSHRRSRHPSLDDSHNMRRGGCWTCRVRRKKCDPQGEGDSCKTCQRLRINCLGWGSKRPEWMRDKKNVDAYKASIKAQLSQAGLIRSQSRHQPPQVPKSPNEFSSLPHVENVGATGTDSSSWSGRSLPHPIVAQPMQMDVGEFQAVNSSQEVVVPKIRPVSAPPATLQSHRRRGMYFAKGQEVYIREDNRALSAVV
ncbi:hypothetical protein M413DRAFT_80533 [Hebeloma cylindrosporum]|uniref:Zn(2)-C6 fungal-type domain-containing protein n=1 Tax=Hebeloma cylindrosporum TaxID=76867 RepID=A0A0C2YFL5_HEBCY|nr:hypothetical protein M413DRAFT_80533 [Hebeloma cylindrosporum h7]